MRHPVSYDLARARRILHDRDASIWPDDELLAYYQDAYELVCTMAQGVRTFRTVDMPPRHTTSYMHTWERTDGLAANGTARQMGFTKPDGGWCMYRWEAEQAEGIDPQEIGGTFVMHLWELASTGNDNQQQYYMALPEDRERLVHAWYDHHPMMAVSVRELDRLGWRWWMTEGRTDTWTLGRGPVRTVELFRLQTSYHQSYELRDDSQGLHGTPYGIAREITGDRVYALDYDDSAPYGLIRGITSPNRQYLALPQWHTPLGTLREWGSSDGALLLLEVALPEKLTLGLDDIPEMVPAILQKYLRYYVVARALGRQGPGYRADVAAWYTERWRRGPVLLRRLLDMARRSRVMQRSSL